MRQVSLVFCVLLLLGCEQSTFAYANVADAREANMFEKGWLPEILPSSAEHIEITTEVDVGRCSGGFSLPAKDLPSFRAQLSPQRIPFKYDAWRDEIERFEKEGRDVLYYQSSRATFAFSCDATHGTCEFVCG